MTDDETSVVETTPKTKTRPHRRTRPLTTTAPKAKATAAPSTGDPSVPTHLNGTVDTLAQMEEFDAKIAARRRPSDEPSSRHPLNYNYPLAPVRRPDGDIVELQSDPNNRMMYEDLGFVYLSSREAREWYDVIQPRVVAEQRRKALLITTMRRFAQREGFVIEYDELGRGPDAILLSDMSIPELEEVFGELEEQYGKKIRLPRTKADRERPAQEPLEQIEGAKLQRRMQAGRLVEVQPGQRISFGR